MSAYVRHEVYDPATDGGAWVPVDGATWTRAEWLAETRTPLEILEDVDEPDAYQGATAHQLTLTADGSVLAVRYVKGAR